MSSVHPILRKKPNKQGLHPIAICVTQQRKRTLLHTGQYIDIRYWDSARRIVKKSHPNAVRLNNFINAKQSEANRIILEAINQFGDNFSIDEFKSLSSTSYSTTLFTTFAENYLTQLEDAKKYTRVNSERPLLNKIQKLTDKDFSFDEITVPFLRKLSARLKRDGAMSGRSIANVFMFIRVLYNRAIEENLAKRDNYPFGDGKGKFKITIPESIKIGLSEDEVKRIEDLTLPQGDPKSHARNVWLFSFYLAGMRVADVLKVKWSDIHDGRLYYRMGKNEKTLSLKISDKLQRILNQYDPQGDRTRTYVFSELDGIDTKDTKLVLLKTRNANHKFNKNLKKVAVMCDINKPLSMHIARHTFGNISGNHIPIRMLQKLYRHSNITTTINYQQNFIHEETDEALDKVINF